MTTPVEKSITGDFIDGDGLAALYNPTSGNVEVKDKTVVIKWNHRFDNPIVINGTVNLILRDGVTMTCTKIINVASGHTLNIYGQTNNSGKLIVTGGENNAAIGSIENVYAGRINIHGGNIEAAGGQNSAGIGGGTYRGFDVDPSLGGLTIYGGKVTAQGGVNGAGIGGS